MDQKIAVKQLKEIKRVSRNIQLAGEKWPSKFQTLISIILSARTRDETTIKICNYLFKKYKTAQELSKANLKEIEKIIKPINFYKNKAKNILNCAKFLIVEHNSNVPMKFEDLITLPGVGRKTANVFLSEYGQDKIGVDTHVAYISKKMQWTKNIKPEKIEKDLENLFPKEYWRILNRIMVKFGKTYTSKNKKDILIEGIRKIK